MRVVITGASGFIAPYVAKTLRDAGCEVVPVARRPADHILQIADYSQTPPADVIVHLAQDADRERVNAQPDAHVPEVIAQTEALISRYQRVVYISSATLYGDRCLTPRSTMDPVISNDAYARIKLGCEQAVLTHPGGVVARLANIYGHGQSDNTVLATILRQAGNEGPMTVRDDTPVRDFLWVEDAADCLAEMAVGTPTGIFNLGSGVGTSVQQLILHVFDILGQSDRAVVTTAPVDRVSSLVLDIEQTLATWRWRPAVPMREGLRRLLNIRGLGN